MLSIGDQQLKAKARRGASTRAFSLQAKALKVLLRGDEFGLFFFFHKPLEQNALVLAHGLAIILTTRNETKHNHQFHIKQTKKKAYTRARCNSHRT